MHFVVIVSDTEDC